MKPALSNYFQPILHPTTKVFLPFWSLAPFKFLFHGLVCRQTSMHFPSPPRPSPSHSSPSLPPFLSALASTGPDPKSCKALHENSTRLRLLETSAREFLRIRYKIENCDLLPNKAVFFCHLVFFHFFVELQFYSFGYDFFSKVYCERFARHSVEVNWLSVAYSWMTDFSSMSDSLSLKKSNKLLKLLNLRWQKTFPFFTTAKFFNRYFRHHINNVFNLLWKVSLLCTKTFENNPARIIIMAIIWAVSI